MNKKKTVKGNFSPGIMKIVSEMNHETYTISNWSPNDSR